MKKFRAFLKSYTVLGIVIACCMNAQMSVHASTTSLATAYGASCDAEP